MQKKNRIGRKLIALLYLFFSIIVILLLVGSYLAHSNEVDGIYKERVERISSIAASLLDGDFVKELRALTDSEDFQELHREAVAKDDPELLNDCLREKGLYDRYAQSTELLRNLQERAGVEYLYVQNVGKEDAVYLLDPSESVLNLGFHEKNADELADVITNVRLPATVTQSEYGWLCTCAELVHASDGSVPAVVCADLDMNQIIKRRHEFAFVMFILSVAVLLGAAVGGSFYIRKVVSDPITRLAREAGAFGQAEDEETLKAQVITLPEKRDDEIWDLYADIQKMQQGIIQYMDNLKVVTEEKERIGTELNIANQIQASMLPNMFPAFPDRQEFDIYAKMKPAKMVAGDFYDFFLIDDDHLGIVMADVSGKGIPASLFMMMAKIVISNFALPGSSPHEILEEANERICRNNDAEMFVTVWLGILTISTGHIVAANAGHEYPVVQNIDGTYELMKDKHGFVIGGMDGVRYRDYEFVLQPGQTVFLYTDGVPEATRMDNEQFGTGRLLEALNRRPHAELKEMIQHVQQEVDDFVGDAEQFDDITMLALRYRG